MNDFLSLLLLLLLLLCFFFSILDAPDPCESQPCNNGGVCIKQGYHSFECTCAKGFGGDVCAQGNSSYTMSLDNSTLSLYIGKVT